MSEIRELASGLRFPEGPVALADGSILVVEMLGQKLTRIDPDGHIDVVAECGGGPNGAAVGPDGGYYICNNGGMAWEEVNGKPVITHVTAPDYKGGRIERVDPATGRVDVLYEACDGHRLSGPNDLVFDAHGGFYFTDPGKFDDRTRDRGYLYYAKADGSSIKEISREFTSPNGVGLSPDQATLYVSETYTGRVWALTVNGPGDVEAGQNFLEPPGRLVAGLPGFQLLDSLAVDSTGSICVGTLANGGITRLSPDGSKIEHFPMPDPYTTNICFGANNLRTAYITLSDTGRLVSMEWPVPGLQLNYQELPRR